MLLIRRNRIFRRFVVRDISEKESKKQSEPDEIYS